MTPCKHELQYRSSFFMCMLYMSWTLSGNKIIFGSYDNNEDILQITCLTYKSWEITILIFSDMSDNFSKLLHIYIWNLCLYFENQPSRPSRTTHRDTYGANSQIFRSIHWTMGDTTLFEASSICERLPNGSRRHLIRNWDPIGRL